MKYWKCLSHNVWEYIDEIKILPAFYVPLRCTLIRLKSGKLWLHSPCKFSPGAIEELNLIGEVAYIIAPNAFHHLFLSASCRTFPSAEVWIAPNVQTKQKTLKGFRLLGRQTPWEEEIITQPLRGAPFVDEHLFFHKESKTFLCTDLLFNLHSFKNIWTHFLISCVGANKKLAQGHEWKILVRNRSLFAEDMREVLGWDFERIVMAHGDVIESTNARDLFRKATSWSFGNAQIEKQ